MMLFSPSARRYIDMAVRQLADSSAQAKWKSWLSERPQLRVVDGPADDGMGPMPRETADLIIAALYRLRSNMERKRSTAPEDESYVLDNDISYIESIEAAIASNTPAVAS